MKLLLALLLALPIPDHCMRMKGFYNDYNEKYFEGRLPKNVIITWGHPAKDGYEDIALTYKDEGRFHMVFSLRYATAPNVAHLALLHESCHLLHWSDELDDHGPKWQGCMLHLAEIGAMGQLW